MNNEEQQTWEVGDVLQIDPEHDKVFGAAFLVVTEPKAWGAQGYVIIPGEDGLAYYRVKFSTAKKVGKAEWIISEKEED